MLERLFAQIKIEVPGVQKVNADAAAVGNVLNVVFTLVGGLAVLFLLVGAVRYVTSQGDQAALTQAKNTILYAVIGIVVSLSGFAIVQLVVGTLSS